MKKSLEINYEELLKIISDRIGSLPEDAHMTLSGAGDAFALDSSMTLTIIVDVPLPDKS